ncbi:MAG: hypothetical protein SFW63_07395 [Alphaproteobacteria bacterium]|nr:hypothetical protein [Alphaproteobacteria bacterium]
MSKAAVFDLRDDALVPAIMSARNSAGKLLDLMYGNPDRVKITMAFAFALLIMGMSMAQQAAHHFAACPA